MACYSKKTSGRAKGLKLVTHIWGTFDLVVFKVILGSFCELSVTHKELVVERKELKFGTLRDTGNNKF